MDYARRQQCRRVSHAAKAALGGVAAAMLGLAVASAGAAPLAGLLLFTAVGLRIYARHWLSLARRSRVGVRSEDEVQRALGALWAERWRLRHSLPWQGRGDIDSVAISPTGIAVAIETKTRSYESGHLARVLEQAARLSRRRRRWARSGALGVLCLVRARRVERVDGEVIVVSIDRLTYVLRAAERMCCDTTVGVVQLCALKHTTRSGTGHCRHAEHCIDVGIVARPWTLRCLRVTRRTSERLWTGQLASLPLRRSTSSPSACRRSLAGEAGSE